MAQLDLGKVKGEDGAAATIAVGTVTTGPAGSAASVTNSGTSAAAVFNFTIPKGDNGQGEIPDDSISGRKYVIGVDNKEMYLLDNQLSPAEKKIATLRVKHTWTVTT